MEADVKRTVEALLFASPVPLSLSRLQGIIPRSDRRSMREAVETLRDEYDAAGHAFQLEEIAGGWRVMTRPDYTRVIEEMMRGQRRVRLSKPALEVLAVVAYRQPCTRVDVESVRGVNCGGPLATLIERGMLRIMGRAETLGRPLLYGTTDEFLSHLGVNRLEDLPQLSEIEALLSSGENGDGPVAPEERRVRLLEGMESIADMIGAGEESEPAGGNGNGDSPPPEPELDIALADSGNEQEEYDQNSIGGMMAEHARVLSSGLAREREALAAGAAALPADGDPEPDDLGEPVELREQDESAEQELSEWPPEEAES